jgi:hypothetical protein
MERTLPRTKSPLQLQREDPGRKPPLAARSEPQASGEQN